MSFRCRQRIVSFGAFPTEDYVLEPTRDGQTQLKKVSNNIKLPPVETTDLKTMLEQGVNLEQVNTKILGARGTFDYAAHSPKPEDKPEDKSDDKPIDKEV